MWNLPHMWNPPPHCFPCHYDNYSANDIILTLNNQYHMDDRLSVVLWIILHGYVVNKDRGGGFHICGGFHISYSTRVHSRRSWMRGRHHNTVRNSTWTRPMLRNCRWVGSWFYIVLCSRVVTKSWNGTAIFYRRLEKNSNIHFQWNKNWGGGRGSRSGGFYRLNAIFISLTLGSIITFSFLNQF